MGRSGQVRHHRRVAKSRATGRRVIGRRVTKAGFSLALVALASAMTYNSARHLFSTADLVEISSLALAVNALLLTATVWLVRSQTIANAIIAGITLAGLLTMHVVHTDIYGAGIAIMLLVSCGAYFALFVGLRAIDDRPWVGAALAAMALAGMGVVLLGPLVRSTVPPPRVDRMIPVTFQQKPNVYLVSFDGMIPAALLGRLGVDSTPFHDLMSRRFRVFRNFFTNDVTTTAAFNTLLSLDESVKMMLPDLNAQLFAGTQDTPMFRLFRRNGYEITTLFGDYFFGSRGGPYVDNYIVTQPQAVCRRLDSTLRPLSFYGYCAVQAWLDDIAVSSEVARLRNLPTHTTYMSGYVAHQRIIDHVLKASESEQPQLMLAHIYCPGHESKHFDMRNEDHMAKLRSWYIPDIAYAAGLLEQIVEHLEAHDPSAILFVFGDHGPLLTQGGDGNYERSLFITDHFGTVGGTFPPHRCSPYLRPPTGRKGDYMTTLDAMHGIIRCLSGGQWATNVIRVNRRTVRYNQPYEDYLYE